MEGDLAVNKRGPGTPGTRCYWSLDYNGIRPSFHIHPSCSSSQRGVPSKPEPPRTGCSSSIVHTHLSFQERRGGIFCVCVGSINVFCREESMLNGHLYIGSCQKPARDKNMPSSQHG